MKLFLTAFKSLNTKFGHRAQIIKAIEELAELQQVLCHYLNKDVKDGSHENIDIKSIITELADVQIVTGFLIKIFDCENQVEEEIEYKLNRVLSNLQK